MNYIYPLNTTLKLSQICFGGEQLGGFNWGSYDIRDTIEAANQAIDRGLNFFDTADCYGLGESEVNIGKLINGRREQCVIGTKFGVKVDASTKGNSISYDNSVSYIKSALDASLKRLQTDYIDIYQVHYWDKTTPLEEVFSSLERLCESGKIRYYGVSNFDCLNFSKTDFPNLLSFSYECSLANRSNQSSIAEHINHGLTFLSYGSLGQGILTGKYNKDSTFDTSDRRNNEKYVNFYGDKLLQNLAILGRMREVKSNFENVSLAQIALRWIIDKFPDVVLITGIKNTRQLEDNLKVFDFSLSQNDLNILDSVSSI